MITRDGVAWATETVPVTAAKESDARLTHTRVPRRVFTSETVDAPTPAQVAV